MSMPLLESINMKSNQKKISKIIQSLMSKNEDVAKSVLKEVMANIIRENYNDGDYDYDDRSMFADPGGKSALRAATRDNPRKYPCPTCEQPNRLTPADVRRGYQCDECADRDERGF